MMSRLFVAGSALLVIMVTTVLFWNAYFGIAQSTTSIQQSISSGKPSEITVTVPRELGLHVAGPATLAHPVRDQLVAAFERSPEFDTVIVLDHPTQQADIPLLIVELESRQWVWTPFYADSELVAVLQYASDGNVTNITPPRVLGPDVPGRLRFVEARVVSTDPALIIFGGVALEDTTRGLFSRPYYNRTASTAIATQISDRIESIVADIRASS